VGASTPARDEAGTLRLWRNWQTRWLEVSVRGDSRSGSSPDLRTGWWHGAGGDLRTRFPSLRCHETNTIRFAGTYGYGPALVKREARISTEFRLVLSWFRN
jgi:hypothetical protein